MKKKPIGFGKRKWGGKPKLHPQVVKEIHSRVSSGSMPSPVLELLCEVYLNVL